VFAHRLPESEFFPAAGQGAIGLEVRADDDTSRAFAEAICHADTWTKVTAEREFLRLLDGGCHTPVGVYSHLEDGVISLFARVFPEEGGTPQTGEATGTDPITVAHELFQSLS
jgi:hydroxymethylbilane synthase